VQGTSHFIFLRSGLYIWSRTVRLEIVRTEKGTSLWAVPLFTANLISGLSSQVHHMNVGAEPYVIRQIPTLVVGVVIDHNVVAVPQPAITESHVRRCDVPVPSVEPKTSGATTAEVPNMVATESAGEVSVLPRFVEMQAGIVASGVMTYPFVSIHVGYVGMTRLVAKFATGSNWFGRSMEGFRTPRGRRSVSLFWMLGEDGDRDCKKHEQRCVGNSHFYLLVVVERCRGRTLLKPLDVLFWIRFFQSGLYGR